MKKLKAVLLALTAATVLAAGLMLAGCSDSSDPKKAVEKAVTAEFDAVKKPGDDMIGELSADMLGDSRTEKYGIDPRAFVISLLGGFDYSIEDIIVAQDGATATVKLSVTCKNTNDAAKIAEDLTTDWITENGASAGEITMEEANRKAGEILMQAVDQCELTTKPVQVTYELVDGTWTLSPDSEPALTQMFEM